MMVFIRLFPLLLIGYAYGLESNPCEGDVFSLACQMFEQIKKDTATEKQDLEQRFNDISLREQTDLAETKQLIVTDIATLTKKVNEDIASVAKATEEKLKALKNMLESEITEQSSQKIDKAIGKLKEKMVIVRANVEKKISDNTVNFNKGLKNLESSVAENIKAQGDAFEKALGQFKKEVDEYDEKLGVKVEKISEDSLAMLSKIEANAKSYKKGLKDLSGNLEAYKKSSKQDLTEQIASVESKVAEKQDALKKQLDNTIAEKSVDLKKTFEKELASKSESLEKEIASKVATVKEDLVKTIEGDVGTMFAAWKKTVSAEISGLVDVQLSNVTKSIGDIWKVINAKEWPEGHYCVYKSGDCPKGFTSSMKWYCCK